MRVPLLLVVMLSLPVQAQVVDPGALSVQEQFSAQDYEDVIVQLEAKAMRSEAESYVLGRAYQEEFQHQRALESFAEADTMSVRVLRARAVSQERLGRHREAIATYRRALDVQPGSIGLTMALARLLNVVRDFETARQLLAAASAAKPETPTIRVEYAKTLVALDSLGGAIVQLELAHRQAPASATIPLLLSQVYLTAELPTSAARVLERGLDVVDEDPRLWARLGAVRHQLEVHDGAIDAYETALALGDSSASTWRGLGMNRYLDGAPRPALTALDASYAADSTNARTAFYLGLAHKQLEAYVEAERWLTLAATLTGRQPLADILEHLADAQRFQDEYRAAIETDQVVLYLSPGRLSTTFHLAVLFDEYYADSTPAIRQFEAFIEQAMASPVAERSDTLVMVGYAQNRIRALREATFFDVPEADAELQADSSDTDEGGTGAQGGR
ncbi:MAG: tetratricopeptide repeat protein [Bacteroidota bacterium]